MKRRSFIGNTLGTLPFLQAMPLAHSFPAQENIQSYSFSCQRDGTFFLLIQQKNSPQITKLKVVEHGDLICIEKNVRFHKDQLLLTPLQLRDLSGEQFVYFEGDPLQNRIIRYHFLTFHFDKMSLEHQGSFDTKLSAPHWNGNERFHLVFQDEFKNSRLLFLYEKNGLIGVGGFVKNQNEFEFQKFDELSLEFASQLQDAIWHGPFPHLIEQNKNIFIAEKAGEGLFFFQFHDGKMSLFHRIVNGQQIGPRFTYWNPKIKPDENPLEEKCTRVFKELKPYDPQNILTGQSVIALVSDEKLIFLAHNEQTSDFEIAAESKNFKQDNFIFLDLLNHMGRDKQPTLFIIQKEKNLYYAFLVWCFREKIFKFYIEEISMPTEHNMTHYYALHFIRRKDFQSSQKPLRDRKPSADSYLFLLWNQLDDFYQNGELRIDWQNKSGELVYANQEKRYFEKKQLPTNPRVALTHTMCSEADYWKKLSFLFLEIITFLTISVFGLFYYSMRTRKKLEASIAALNLCEKYTKEQNHRIRDLLNELDASANRFDLLYQKYTELRKENTELQKLYDNIECSYYKLEEGFNTLEDKLKRVEESRDDFFRESLNLAVQNETLMQRFWNHEILKLTIFEAQKALLSQKERFKELRDLSDTFESLSQDEWEKVAHQFEEALKTAENHQWLLSSYIRNQELLVQKNENDMVTFEGWVRAC